MFPIIFLIILFLSTVSTQQCSDNWDSFVVKKGPTEYLKVDQNTNTVIIDKLNAKTQIIVNGVNVLQKINSLQSEVNALKNAPAPSPAPLPKLSRRLVRSSTSSSKTASVAATCQTGEIAVSCDIIGTPRCEDNRGDTTGTPTFSYTDSRTCTCSCTSGTARWSNTCSANCLKLIA